MHTQALEEVADTTKVSAFVISVTAEPANDPQSVHSTFPVPSEYLPLTHPAHEASPAPAYLPASHGVHVPVDWHPATFVRSPTLPAEHRHVGLPVAVVDEPVGHDSHCVAPSHGMYVPTAHGVHAPSPTFAL